MPAFLLTGGPERKALEVKDLFKVSVWVLLNVDKDCELVIDLFGFA